jgi:hypothetical protein
MRTRRAVASGGASSRIHLDQERAMNKLRLSLDDLAVDTFQTGEARTPRRGTVDAHAETVKIVCTISTLKTDLTCCPCTPMF